MDYTTLWNLTIQSENRFRPKEFENVKYCLGYYNDKTFAKLILYCNFYVRNYLCCNFFIDLNDRFKIDNVLNKLSFLVDKNSYQ